MHRFGRYAACHLEHHGRVHFQYARQTLELNDARNLAPAVLEGVEALPLHGPEPRNFAIGDVVAQPQSRESVDVFAFVDRHSQSPKTHSALLGPRAAQCTTTASIDGNAELTPSTGFAKCHADPVVHPGRWREAAGTPRV